MTIDTTDMPDWVQPGKRVYILRDSDRAPRSVRAATVDRMTARDIVVTGLRVAPEDARFRRGDLTPDRATVRRFSGSTWALIIDELVAELDPRIEALLDTVRRDNIRTAAVSAAGLMNTSTAAAGALDDVERVNAAVRALTAWRDVLAAEATSPA